MGNFLNELHIRPRPGQHMWWMLTKPLTYKRDDLMITVPDGFCTDLASVPRLLWSIFPPYGRYTEASVIHDYCYCSKYRITRKEADQLFYDIMVEQGVSKIQARLMYWGVRVVGAGRFRKR